MAPLQDFMAPTIYSLGFLEILVALLCFFLFWIWGDIHGLPWNWPFLGMFPGLFVHINRIHDRCTDVLARAGGTFLLKGPWFLDMDILGTVDPANVHYIMSANFANFPKGSEFKKIFDVLGDGIFNSDLELWKLQRKLARALITHHKFHTFLLNTTWNKVERGLIPILEHVAKKNVVVDLQDLFQRLTFDTTCTLVTGYDPGCLSIALPDVPFSKAMDDAEEAIFLRHIVPERIWKFQRWLGIGHERKLSEAWEVLDRVIGKYVSMKRKELSRGKKGIEQNQEGFDLLTAYINEDQSNGFNSSDDKFLRDTILNLMIAGRDTSSSALTWFIWLVSTHPEVEEKIRAELKTVIQPNEEGQFRLFKSEELKNMVYLHAALCESLRLYPPVPFQHKSPTKPDILPSGHNVDTKTKVMFSLYAMGRMEFIWGKDCLEFKPERWISESTGKVKHEPSYKFLAFNAGPRTCLGKEVAFIQMKAVSAAVIYNYQVHVEKSLSVIPNVSIILYMKHGLKVRVSKRWSALN